jgi:hypothetical protein
MRLYAAPFGLWLTLDAGTFESISINPNTHAVRVVLSPADAYTTQARLRIEQPAKVAGVSNFDRDIAGRASNEVQERGAYVIPLSAQSTHIDLMDVPSKKG